MRSRRRTSRRLGRVASTRAIAAAITITIIIVAVAEEEEEEEDAASVGVPEARMVHGEAIEPVVVDSVEVVEVEVAVEVSAVALATEKAMVVMPATAQLTARRRVKGMLPFKLQLRRKGKGKGRPWRPVHDDRGVETMHACMHAFFDGRPRNAGGGGADQTRF